MNVRERMASRPGEAPAELAARYKSLFEIGRGGMGTIEVALEKAPELSSGFSRVVALKRMHPHARERRHVEMFLREARLAALLVHPNVVHAFAFGEIEGELFLAMEYVEGETLSTMVKAAREKAAAGLPVVIVAAVLADVCEGLHAAHELRDPDTGAPLNVIHRDVSPHNVMVSYEGHVKLLDFGVAKMDSVDPLTRTGEVKGKTAYMSPEQAMGDPVDRRTDLFALGSVLFECLAGRKMWGGGTDLEVLRKLALEAPPRLEEGAPHAPRELCELHARLVARDPKARPATALEVAKELRAIAARVAPRDAWSSAAIAGMMSTLFAADAAQRQQRLNEALHRTAPSMRVEVLRRSLAGPTALAAIAPPAIARARSAPPPSIAPPTLADRPNRASERPEPAGPKASGVVVSILVGLAIALGIAYAGTRASGKSGSATTGPTTTATSSTPAVTATPVPSAATTPTATAAATAATSAGSAPSSRPRPRSSAPAHPVDVDPNPL